MKLFFTQSSEFEVNGMRFLTNIDISNFYTNFLSIDRQDVEFIINEYQSNQALIEIMSLEQRLDIQCIYLEALYNVENYGLFLRKVDDTIEEIIANNIVDIRNENVFELLLYKKAFALFHFGMIKESEKIIMELIKIHPYPTQYKALLIKILYKKYEGVFINLKWASIFIVLASALVYGVNLIIIKPIFSDYMPILFDIGFILLNLGFGVYIVGELIGFSASVITANHRISRVKRKKRQASSN